MSDFVLLCASSDLPEEGMAKELAVQGRQLCVARVNGEVTAMDNECPHRGGPLAEGMIEDGKIVCPWHAWAFDRHTGEAAHSASAKVTVYQIKLDGDEVFIEL